MGSQWISGGFHGVFGVLQGILEAFQMRFGEPQGRFKGPKWITGLRDASGGPKRFQEISRDTLQ